MSALPVPYLRCPYDFDRFARRCKEKKKDGACLSAGSADGGGFTDDARKDERAAPIKEGSAAIARERHRYLLTGISLFLWPADALQLDMGP